MLLAAVSLHRPGCLHTRTAEGSSERVDELNMRAIVADQDYAIVFFANLVHTSSLLSFLAVHQQLSKPTRHQKQVTGSICYY